MNPMLELSRRPAPAMSHASRRAFTLIELPLPPQVISLADLTITAGGKPSEMVALRDGKLVWRGALAAEPTLLEVAYTAVGKGLYELSPSSVAWTRTPGTSSDHAHKTVVSIRSARDRLEAPRADALVDSSDRRVCGEFVGVWIPNKSKEDGHSKNVRVAPCFHQPRVGVRGQQHDPTRFPSAKPRPCSARSLRKNGGGLSRTAARVQSKVLWERSSRHTVMTTARAPGGWRRPRGVTARRRARCWRSTASG